MTLYFNYFKEFLPFKESFKNQKIKITYLAHEWCGTGSEIWGILVIPTTLLECRAGVVPCKWSSHEGCLR